MLKRFILFSLLLLSSAVVFFHCKNRKVLVYKLTLENIQSQVMSVRLNEFVKYAYVNGYLATPAIFYQELKKSFKIVKGIKWDNMDPIGLNLTIVGVTPEWVVNNEFIVGDKQRLYLKEYFANIEGLKKITISEEHYSEKLNSSVYEFLQKIPHDLPTRYTINYKNKREILLNDKERMILADEITVLDQKKLQYANDIRDGKKVFDIRFDGRIIAKSRIKKTDV